MKTQSCVIDCCSLLHSFHLQLDGTNLNGWLEQAFDVTIPLKVEEELSSVLPRAYQDWKRSGLVSEEMSEIRRSHAAYLVDKRAEGDLSKQRELFQVAPFSGLDAGEIDCVALVKRLSDSQCSYVLFLTDDYDAGECAREAFDQYQCGMAVRTADIILFFGFRLNLARSEVHQCLRTLISFYNNQYDALLEQIKRNLPEAEGSTLTGLILRGDYDRAKETIRGFRLKATLQAEMVALIEEIKLLASANSTLGHTLTRLRSVNIVPV